MMTQANTYKSYKDTPGYRPLTHFEPTVKAPGDYVFGEGGTCFIVQKNGQLVKKV